MTISPAIHQAAALLRHRRETAERIGLTLTQRREAFEKNCEPLSALTDIDIEPVTLGGVSCERLNRRATGGTLLYLHGGGYCLGSPRTHRRLAGEIARASDRRCVSPDYRLAPEHPFPAGLDDALAVYEAVLAEDGSPPVLAGDSAGGGLALALALRLAAARRPLPPAIAVLSPWTDLTMSGASINERAGRDPYMHFAGLKAFAEAYAPLANRANPLVSPLFGALRGLPPLLIQVGSEEILHDDAARFSERASRHGVACRLDVGEGLFHVWQAVPAAPEADRAIRRIGRFLAGSDQAPSPAGGSTDLF